MKYKLIIAVYGCITIPKYRDQIIKINKTWANQAKDQVKIIYFLGEEKVTDCNYDFSSDTYVYLPGVKNDYLSASYKQNLGLKYVYENYDFDFVLCCGTDTFVNIPKMLLLLSQFNPSDDLYIGGHGCHRKIGDKVYYFQSGGPGFVLTKGCLDKLYPICDNLTEKWFEVCDKNDIVVQYTSCDLAISYFLQEHNNSTIIKIDGLRFMHCNYLGDPCHYNMPNVSEIVSCHNMSLQDFDNFYDILIKNNFFV